MRKPVFMILGAGIGQIKAINTVKSLGMNVLAIDKDPEAKGIVYADYFENIDIINFDDSLKVAKKYNIVGSMTISSDIAVPTSCYINEALSLPLQGENIADVVTDKVLMRDAFVKGKVNSPKHYCINNESDLNRIINDTANIINENRHFIMKPSDSSGSRGVTKIDNIRVINDAYDNALSFSRNGKVVLEEFIYGLELGAQGFFVNGRMEYCFIHGDTVSENMIPVGHSFPINLSLAEIKAVQNECSKALNSLGIENGPSNIDIILKENGEPYIIEIGARIGATRLPELLEAHTSIDIVALSILLACGREVSLPEPKNIPCAAELLYFNEQGIIKNINDYQHLLDIYKPLDHEIFLGNNMEIRPLLSGADNYGYVLFEDNSASLAEQRCSQFIKDLKGLIEWQ